jgi:hypothetical protein
VVRLPWTQSKSEAPGARAEARAEVRACLAQAAVWAAPELAAPELAVPEAAESTQVGPMRESVVRAADLAAAAAAWAARVERDRAAVAQGAPWMEDRASTAQSSPARSVLGWILRPRATPCAEPRATVQVALIAGQAPRRGRPAVPSLARCNPNLHPTIARWIRTAALEKCAYHRQRKFPAAVAW